MAYEQELNVEIYNYWTPKPSYINDRNIMEVAVEDKYFRNKNRFKLESINKCQMYLQVFFISEMEIGQGITKDGKTERKELDMEKDKNKVSVDMFNWGPCVTRMMHKGSRAIHA